MSTYDVLFDGSCSMCRRSLAPFRRLDHRRTFRFHDAGEPTVLARFPAVTAEEARDAMFAVRDDGKLFRGFFAFREMVRASPWAWVLLPLFHAPGAAWIGPRIYAWVARHRPRMGCSSPACELPARPPGPVA
jgi:predicted DCC family thiol-disulfide oxidoreductase YuxK